MRYSNPELPGPDEDLNSHGNLQELLRLLAIVCLIIGSVVLVIDRIVYFAAPLLPFSWEMALADSLNVSTFMAAKTRPTTNDQAIEHMLQNRSAQIARQMKLAADMPITVHYVDNDMVNAFATLGGHVFVFKGILDKMHYDEELDALLAHEMAHVQKRHMTRQMARAILLSATLIATRLNKSGLGRWILGDSSQLGMLAYSRAAEAESDQVAINVSLARYGHTEGMVSLMTTLASLPKNRQSPPWLQSHPDTRSRIDIARRAMAAHAPVAMHALPGYCHEAAKH